jgi:hypothetical protein
MGVSAVFPEALLMSAGLWTAVLLKFAVWVGETVPYLLRLKLRWVVLESHSCRDLSVFGRVYPGLCKG